MAIEVKRVYDEPDAGDGFRVLVDRLWPRGVSKERAALDLWLKEAAPSDGLRRELHGDATRWPELRERYFAELEDLGEVLAPVAQRARQGTVTFLYAARNPERNNAVALKEYFEENLL